MKRDEKGIAGCLLVLFCFLLDVTDLLRDLLQSVLVSGVLQLEVCDEGSKMSKAELGVAGQASYLAASWRVLVEKSFC